MRGRAGSIPAARLALDNQPPKAIALRLEITQETVYDHLGHIYRILDVAGLVELMYVARMHWQCCRLEELCGRWGR